MWSFSRWPLCGERSRPVCGTTHVCHYSFDRYGPQDDFKRKEVKKFVREWEQLSPGRTDSMFAALSNVAPSLLLERRLFDFEALRASDQADGQEDAWWYQDSASLS
jgi:tRNA(Ile)-lysidine synthase TilS/MesJ